MRWRLIEIGEGFGFGQLECTGGDGTCTFQVSHVLEHDGRILYRGNAVCEIHATEEELKTLREEYEM
jgi:hypothetical protein